MSGDVGTSQTVPWAKDIIVRLFHCLQRYPFPADVRGRAVEHVRRRCLQLITADDFKELGKELSEIIHPVKLIDVLQATCGTAGNTGQDTLDNTAPASSTATKHHQQQHAHKRRRQSETVSDVAAHGAAPSDPSLLDCGNDPHSATGILKPEPVRIVLPQDRSTTHDPNITPHTHHHSRRASSPVGGESMVHSLLHIVKCLRLPPDQVHALIRALQSHLHQQQHQQTLPGSADLNCSSLRHTSTGLAAPSGSQHNPASAQVEAARRSGTEMSALHGSAQDGGGGDGQNTGQVPSLNRTGLTINSGIDSSTLESSNNTTQPGATIHTNNQDATGAATTGAVQPPPPSSLHHSQSPTWASAFHPPRNMNETWQDPHTHNPHPPGSSQPSIPSMSMDMVLHATLPNGTFNSPSTPVAMSQPSPYITTQHSTHLPAHSHIPSLPHSMPSSIHPSSLSDTSTNHAMLGVSSAMNPALSASLMSSPALMAQWPLLTSWPQTLRNHFASPLLLAAASAASHQAAQASPPNT